MRDFGLTKKAEPPGTCDMKPLKSLRTTESANPGWLRRLVRQRHVSATKTYARNAWARLGVKWAKLRLVTAYNLLKVSNARLKLRILILEFRIRRLILGESLWVCIHNFMCAKKINVNELPNVPKLSHGGEPALEKQNKAATAVGSSALLGHMVEFHKS